MSNSIVLQNVRIIDPSRNLDEVGTIVVEDGVIVASGKDAKNHGAPKGATVRDCNGLVAIPGLVDARVHVGEPGGEHRETIASASRAAAAGGVTSFIMMPDTDPVIDDIALVEFVRKTARDTAVVNVYPAAALTKGLAGEEMTEIGLLAKPARVLCFAAYAFPSCQAVLSGEARKTGRASGDKCQGPHSRRVFVICPVDWPLAHG